MRSTNNTLVFDLGNTLYPSSLQELAMHQVLEMHGLLHTNYRSFYVRHYSNYPFLGGTLEVNFISELLKSINPKPSVDAYTMLGDYRHNLHNLISDYVKNDPHGTWKYLKDLSKTHKLGILSDNSIHTKGFWQEILSNSDLDIFDFFIVSEEIGVTKPHMKMFFEIKKFIACDFDEITLFGDNLIRDGASAFHGMQFVHISGFTELPKQKNNPYLPTQPMISIEFINDENIDSTLIINNVLASGDPGIINILTN